MKRRVKSVPTPRTYAGSSSSFETWEPSGSTRAAGNTAARIAYFEGRLLQREGKHAEAAESFRAVLASDNTAAEPYLRLGESLRDAGKPEEAETLLRKVLEEPEYVVSVGTDFTRRRRVHLAGVLLSRR